MDLLNQRARYLPHPCEGVLLVRIQLLVRAWFDAMRTQPIVITDVEKHFRQEMLSGQAELRKNTENLQKSVGDLHERIPEHFAGQDDLHAKTHRMLSEAVEHFKTLQPGGIETKAADDEDTALHGQVSAIERNFQQGDVNAAIQQLESLRISHWETATPSEKRRLLAVTANALLEKGDVDSAKRCIGEAIDAFPTYKRVPENRALLYLLNGEYRAAENLAIQVLTQDPTSLNAACMLIQSRRELTDGSIMESIPEALIQLRIPEQSCH